MSKPPSAAARPSLLGRSGRRSAVGRLLVVALAAAGLMVGTTVAPASAAVPAGSTKYVPVAPLRLARTFADSTSGVFGFTTVSTTVLRIKVTDRAGVPVNAAAAVVNVTVVSNGPGGYVNVFPSQTTPPRTANVNVDGLPRRISNLAHVRLGADGAFDLYRSAPYGIVVDLVGVYVPVADTVSDGRFVARPGGATRALDTRTAAGSVTNPTGIPRLTAATVATVDLSATGVPADASAVVLGVAAVTSATGYWNAYASGIERPLTAIMNIDRAGQTRTSQAIVALAGSATVDVFASGGGDLVVDVLGWYTGTGGQRSSDGLFIPSAPVRRLDTRTLRSLAPWGGSTYEFTIPDPASCTGCVAAAVLNVAGLLPWDNGYLTAYPAGQTRPLISSLNFSEWRQVISNHAITGVSTRGVAIYTLSGAHMIADLAGVFLGTPLAAPNPKPTNPNYLPNVATRVYSSQAAVNVGIRTGSNLNTIADTGYAAGWTGLTNVAARGNTMLFAHRTSAGGPFRYLDQFAVNEKFVLVGTDGKRYEYLVVDRRVVVPDYTTIVALANPYGPITAQLVACSRLDGTPTSLRYRIVITGRLVRVF